MGAWGGKRGPIEREVNVVWGLANSNQRDTGKTDLAGNYKGKKKRRLFGKKDLSQLCPRILFQRSPEEEKGKKSTTRASRLSYEEERISLKRKLIDI